MRGEFEAVANRRRVVKASAEQSTEVRGVVEDLEPDAAEEEGAKAFAKLEQHLSN